MDAWVTMPVLYQAYKDCRKRKRGTISCANFEINEALNLDTLLTELNDKTYTIGRSNAFCITRPKLREVFAADFRDRIVHHLVMLKTMPLFEAAFIENTFNCRKGKGTAAAHLKALDYSFEYEQGWVLSCDIQGFFMSIHKETLANRLEAFLREKYKGADLEEIVWLTRMIALHKPEEFCIKKGDISLWDLLPPEKSLFTCGEGLGMAIGNLTSQIYANFYLNDFDHWMTSQPIGYCRYVDDFRVFSNDKNYLLSLIPKIRSYLLQNCKLKLHPKKIELQLVRKGFNFVGVTIKHHLIYINNRTVGNCYNMIQIYNRMSEADMSESVDKFVQRYNSYMGYMVHYATYAIRYNLYNLIRKDWLDKFVYINSTKSVLRAHIEYKFTTKLRKKYYGLRKHSRGRVQGYRTLKVT